MPWVCSSCGAEHVAPTASCHHCGFDGLEAVETADLAERAFTEKQRFRCGDCGRLHPKNRTLCGRCGAGPLERTTVRFYEVSDDRGRFGGLRPYLPGAAAIVVVLVLAVVALGGFIPEIGGQELPEAPGAPDETDMVEFESVEAAVVEELAAASGQDLEHDTGELSDVTTHYNREQVLERVDPGEAGDPALGELVGKWDADCSQVGVLQAYTIESADFETADELAEALLEGWREKVALTAEEWNRVAIDLHEDPDGVVAATALLC